MTELFNTKGQFSSTKGLSFEGLLYDIQEDEGYEQYDLILWALERVIADVSAYLTSGSVNLQIPEGDGLGDERNRDKLYALMGLLNEVDREVLLQYLPKDNGVYNPEVCGGLRLESYVNGESE